MDQEKQERLGKLAAKMVAGDNEAGNAFCKEVWPFVDGYVKKRINDEDLSTELVQASMFAIVDGLKAGKYTERGMIGSWISRVTGTEIALHFRKEERHKKIHDDFQYEIESTKGDVTEIPFPIVGRITCVTEALLSRITEIISGLPEKKQQLFRLRNEERLPYEKVAQIVGLTPNNTKVTNYRIIDLISQDPQMKLLRTA